MGSPAPSRQCASHTLQPQAAKCSSENLLCTTRLRVTLLLRIPVSPNAAAICPHVRIGAMWLEDEDMRHMLKFF